MFVRWNFSVEIFKERKQYIICIKLKRWNEMFETKVFLDSINQMENTIFLFLHERRMVTAAAVVGRSDDNFINPTPPKKNTSTTDDGTIPRGPLWRAICFRMGSSSKTCAYYSYQHQGRVARSVHSFALDFHFLIFGARNTKHIKLSGDIFRRTGIKRTTVAMRGGRRQGGKSRKKYSTYPRAAPLR